MEAPADVDDAVAKLLELPDRGQVDDGRVLGGRLEVGKETEFGQVKQSEPGQLRFLSLFL